MNRETPRIVRGSSNVYRDFDVEDADVRQLKAILPAEMIKMLDRESLTLREAQERTGLDSGDVSRIRNADFRRMSIERLMGIINKLGARIEVRIKVKRAPASERVVAG